ncbi:MAG: hypothetical protein A2X45_11395 [Lentisphaerae bacterium GWF2_50_93]|nr:MAG: hypothetical protein A2X45_11395 [Lentisphaerae bacterium GWF2_50_93]
MHKSGMNSKRSGSIMETSVQIHKGRPSFFVDGQPHPGIFSSAPEAYFRNMTDAGFDIVDTHPYIDIGWVGTGHYDYTLTDQRIEAYLSQHQTAKLILRFWIGYSGKHANGNFWWAEANPDEIIVLEDGKAQKPYNASFASKKFRREAGEALSKVVEHIEYKYGDRIAAYEPGAGPCGEWFHWIAKDRFMVDYSPRMKEAYHLFLKEKYIEICEMNKRWGSQYANFASVPIPSSAGRDQAACGGFASDEVVDFWEFYSRIMAETICGFAAAVKKGCDRRKTVLVFYGYLWGTHLARSGHMALDRVLENPDVDIIATPFMYHFRQLGGVTSSQSVPGTIHSRGKLHLYELDGSTHLKSCWNCRYHSNPETLEDTMGLLERDMNRLLTDGSACWFMDLVGGYFNEPGTVTALGKLREIGNNYRFKAGGNNHQIAILMDPTHSFHFREQDNLFRVLFQTFKQYELELMGMGYDDLTVETLKHLDPEETARYKFWIIPCLLSVDDNVLELLKKHVLRNNNHVLWFYGAGLLGGGRLPDTDFMRDMTGFCVVLEHAEGELSIIVNRNEHPLLRNLPKSRYHYGTYGDLDPNFVKHHAPLMDYPSSVWQGHASEGEGFRIAPRPYIVSGGTSLGKIRDMPDNKTGLAAREMGEWLSVLSTVPSMSRDILKSIAVEAGCHLYTDATGQLAHSENLIGFYSHKTATARFHLSMAKNEVYEVYGGKTLPCADGAFDFQVEKNRAYLFYVGKE